MNFAYSSLVTGKAADQKLPDSHAMHGRSSASAPSAPIRKSPAGILARFGAATSVIEPSAAFAAPLSGATSFIEKPRIVQEHDESSERNYDLDLTRVLSGPYCTMLLADMGARVIKIEQPRSGDDTRHWGPPFIGSESAYFLSINRNKESVTLDFKHPEGRALLDQLIAKSDVIVENFRPGALARLGLDYASLAPENPRSSIVRSPASAIPAHVRRTRYDAVLQAKAD
jgi:hypothetical protein